MTIDNTGNRKRNSVDFHSAFRVKQLRKPRLFRFGKTEKDKNALSIPKKTYSIKKTFFGLSILLKRSKKLLYKNFFWGRGIYYKYSVVFVILLTLLPIGAFANNIKKEEKDIPGTPATFYDAAFDTGGKTVILNNKNIDNIQVYQVQNGDTLSSIATKFGITVDTLTYVNQLNDYSILKVGTSLKILPVSGILYKVNSGDTLTSIAKKYNIAQSGYSEQVILDINNLDSTDLNVNQEILVPGAIIEKPKPIQDPVVARTSTRIIVVPSGSTLFIPPTAGIGSISTCYSSVHPAVDIASNSYPPLVASASGRVVYAGYGLSGGSGIAVSIDHGNGYITQYLHLSQLSVSAGDNVQQGQQIGIMGSTGKSTGPHVHFIIKYNGVNQNPFEYVNLSDYPREYTATSC
ncbi:MAG: peptidoglycan DD-metalloendopeptidase family protein [bacterium]